MKYILTQEELDSLKELNSTEIKNLKTELQTVCTMAAMYTPLQTSIEGKIIK